MLAFMKDKATYQKSLHCSNIKAELLPRSPYDVAYTPDRLVAGFAFEIQTGLHSFGNDRISPFFTPPNTLAFTPVGCDVFSKSDTGGEYLTIALDEKNIDSLFEHKNTCAHRYNNAANKQAVTLAEKLRNQILLVPTDALGIEETALELFEAAAFNTNITSSQRKPASSMTKKRWRLFHDRVEADLSTPIGLEQFAKDLGLSASFFIRAFRAATGSTPHAYIIRRRLNAARLKLTQRTTSIAGIAAETGFANQAHMTSVFSRHLGITPRKYQQLRA
tara:strand:- start:382 stop:1209 length:828 start_codon:yes stop_codon:yes gene_type:complete